MAENSSSFRKAAAALLIVAAGGSAWYFLPKETKDELETAVTQTVQEKVVAPLRDSITEKPKATAEAPEEVGAALQNGEMPAGTEENPLLREVERELARNESGQVTGEAVDVPVPEVGGGIAPAEMPVDEAVEDPVMGFDFINDFAGYLASAYLPGKNGAPGRVGVSMMKANARYSMSSRLHSVESDPFKAREAVIRHICRPGVLEAVYKMYAPRLLSLLEDAARKGGGISDAGIADMLAAYAAFSERIANTFDAAGKVDLKTMVGIIRDAAVKEARANEDFSRAYTAHSAAMDAGNRAEAVSQGSRMAESARLASMHATTQEVAKNDIAWAMRRHAAGASVMRDADLVFLGEWLMRHDIGQESVAKASELLRKFAVLCTEKAMALKGEPAAGPESQASADAF